MTISILKQVFITILVSTILISCEEEPPLLAVKSNLFIGTWKGNIRTLQDTINISLDFEDNGNYFYQETSSNEIIYNELGIWKNLFIDEDFDSEIDIDEPQRLEFSVNDSKIQEHIGKINFIEYDIIENDTVKVVDFQITNANIIRLTKN